MAEPATSPTPVTTIPGPAGPLTDMRELFQLAFEKRASDIHLTEHSPPVIRIDGELMPLSPPPLTRVDTKRLVYSLLNDRQRAQFERDLELDISIEVQGLGRFRINVHTQRGSVEAGFRLVSNHIPNIEELGLPAVLSELARRPNGLVLVTGPTGGGETTTLAAVVDQKTGPTGVGKT